jgi:hypothetical protein
MATIAATIEQFAKPRASALVIAKRSVLKFLRSPQLVVLGTLQGALFLLIFRYVFGGAISTSGVRYVDFLVPGFVTTIILFSGQGAAVAPLLARRCCRHGATPTSTRCSPSWGRTDDSPSTRSRPCSPGT